MLQCNVVTNTFDLFLELEVEGVEKLDSSKTGGGTSLQKTLQPLIQAQKEQTDKLSSLQGQLVVLQRTIRQQQEIGLLQSNRDWVLLAILFVFQGILFWLFK